jgi:hypothetical protein
MLAFVFLIGVLLYALPAAYGGYVMLERFDMGERGFVLGFFFGPLGLIIAWAIRSNEILDLEEKRFRAIHPDVAPPKPRRDPSVPRRFH